MKTPHKRRFFFTGREKSGFTLLEVMIATVILAFSLLGLAGLQVVSVQGNSFAKQITEATTVAQDQLEQLIAGPFAAVVDGTNSLLRDGIVYDIQWTVTPGASTTRKEVGVIVRWEGGTHDVKINSVITEF
jgi:prepilin-type N-terminal cleavage/methylation domain-containing protein